MLFALSKNLRLFLKHKSKHWHFNISRIFDMLRSKWLISHYNTMPGHYIYIYTMSKMFGKST